MKRTREQIHPIVKNSPYTFRDFLKQIAMMIGQTWTTKYEARIAQCISPKGTTNPNDLEQEAMDAWCDVQEDIASSAMKLMSVRNIEAKKQTIIDWLQGRRRYSRADAQSIIRELKNL